MSVSTKLKYLRIAPRKARLVADLIRGKSVEKAQTILNFTIKKAAPPLLKLLNSAMANARNNFHLDEKNLYVSKITIDQGPTYKRWRARARGNAEEIKKRTSHVSLVLDEIRIPKKVKKFRKVPKTVESKIETMEKLKVPESKFKPERKIKKSISPKSTKRIFRRKAF